MDKPRIAAKQPILLTMQPGEYYWCACGKSSSQPFCDGSHVGSGITPIRIKIEEKKDIFWCACKQSSNKPFCDGTHNKL